MPQAARWPAVLLAALFGAAASHGQPALPDAPRPRPEVMAALAPAPAAAPCALQSTGLPVIGPQTPKPGPDSLVPGHPALPAGVPRGAPACQPWSSSLAERRMCCATAGPGPFPGWLMRQQERALTPRDKLRMAAHNLVDPFNLLSIAGEAAITIGSDAHTQYGPGMEGYAKYAGASFTYGMVGEFFGTFLIPSLAHQDPRYYRMPNAPTRRRVRHAFEAVVVGRGDNGRPMFNYATVLTAIAGEAIGYAYVPGRNTGAGASAARVGLSLAWDPAGNLITEFLPDVARHVNVRVVLLQRVINRVVRVGADGNP